MTKGRPRPKIETSGRTPPLKHLGSFGGGRSAGREYLDSNGPRVHPAHQLATRSYKQLLEQGLEGHATVGNNGSRKPVEIYNFQVEVDLGFHMPKSIEHDSVCTQCNLENVFLFGSFDQAMFGKGFQLLEREIKLAYVHFRLAICPSGSKWR